MTGRWSARFYARECLVACTVIFLCVGCGSQDKVDVGIEAVADAPVAAPAEVERSSGLAREGLPRRYTAPFLTTDVIIDGVISDTEWSKAPWSEDYVNIEGLDHPSPAHRTRMKIGWNQMYLLVAAELEEPHLWAEMTEHDSVIWHEDDFEIFIDPDGDRREYYEVEVNARNTIFDLLLEKTYIDGGPAKHDWQLEGLRSAVALQGTLNDPSDEDRGWTVEFALPWSALAERANRPTPPNNGDEWRMNFSRVDWLLEEKRDGKGYEKVEGERERNWVWSPQGEINMHLPEHWGFVRFER